MSKILLLGIKPIAARNFGSFVVPSVVDTRNIAKHSVKSLHLLVVWQSHERIFLRVFLARRGHTQLSRRTNTYQYVHIDTNTFKYIQIHSNTIKYIPIHTNTFQYIQIHSNTYQYIPIRTYQYVQGTLSYQYIPIRTRWYLKLPIHTKYVQGTLNLRDLMEPRMHRSPLRRSLVPIASASHAFSTTSRAQSYLGTFKWGTGPGIRRDLVQQFFDGGECFLGLLLYSSHWRIDGLGPV